MIPALRKPLLLNRRYKVFYGGRGSGKSWSIGEALIELAARYQIRILCTREIQNSISDSVITLLSDTIERLGYDDIFEVLKTEINCVNGSRFMFYGLKSNPTKIKSMEGIDIVWCEEAESISKESWDILIPTIRKDGSQIWITFNPRNILDETYQRFVVNPPKSSVVEKVNFDKNPFFPDVLRREMEECKERDHDQYRHIWLGEPVADSEQAFIKPSWIEAAVDADIKLNIEPSGLTRCGFDVADEGEDKSAIVTAQGSFVFDAAEWQKTKPFISANKVFDYCLGEQVGLLMWDCIGVGADVGGTLERNMEKLNERDSFNLIPFNAGGAVVNAKEQFDSKRTNKDFFENVKAQAWWELRKRFSNTYDAITEGKEYPEDEMIFLSSDMPYLEQLKAELSRPRIDYSENGKVMVESKKKMKKRKIPSPNLADALVMCFAPFELKPENDLVW